MKIANKSYISFCTGSETDYGSYRELIVSIKFRSFQKLIEKSSPLMALHETVKAKQRTRNIDAGNFMSFSIQLATRTATKFQFRETV